MSVITSFEIERVPSGDFEVVHVSSAWQYADFATKPLHTEAFRGAFQFHYTSVMNLWWFLSLIYFPGI